MPSAVPVLCLMQMQCPMHSAVPVRCTMQVHCREQSQCIAQCSPIAVLVQVLCLVQSLNSPGTDAVPIAVPVQCIAHCSPNAVPEQVQ